MRAEESARTVGFRGRFFFLGFPDGSAGEESACHAGDKGDASFIPGSGRSPGGRPGSPLQCSCLGNPMEKLWTEEPGGLESKGSERVRQS